MNNSPEAGGNVEKPRKMSDRRPKAVSRLALSRSVTQIRTDEGQKTVHYSTLPDDAVILNIDGGTTLYSGALQANETIAGLAVSEGEEEIKMNVIGIVKPGPEDTDIAQDELVVIQTGRKAVEHDGIPGTIEGEMDVVTKYVQKHPGQFPANPKV